MREVPGAAFRPSDLPPGKVAVLFCADWCGYCHQFLRHFRKLPGGLVVDVSDDDDPAWDAHGLRVVPTVILYEDGKPARRWAGVLAAQHAEQIRDALAGRAEPPAKG